MQADFLPSELPGKPPETEAFILGTKRVYLFSIILIPRSGIAVVAQRLKRPPGMQDTRVRSLGREDPLEKAMAPHSSTLAWRIPWREEPGRLQSMGSQRVGHD